MAPPFGHFSVRASWHKLVTMSFLEAMRGLARFVDIDDAEVVAEFAWMLLSVPSSPNEAASSLWRLLAAKPASVEVWVAANRVLGSVELEEEGLAVGEELLAHLGECSLHSGQPAPIAVGEGVALGAIPTGPVWTCSFRVMPAALVAHVGRIRSLPVQPRARGALFIDGRRVDEASYPWPRLADSLVSLALEGS
jgi:hypothetical protein